MTTRWKDCADLVLEAIEAAGLADSATVILIGSEARNASNWRSDVDILVVHDDGARLPLRSTPPMHLQQESRTRFLERVEQRDDYPIWALRFGVPLHDPDRWWESQVGNENRHPHWPDWTTKVDRAVKRIRMATALLDTGDSDAAAEEFLYAASHIARAILLRRRVFPLSRPEIPGQLRPYDPELARALDQLIAEDLDVPRLLEIECLLRDRLTLLTELAGNRSG